MSVSELQRQKRKLRTNDRRKVPALHQQQGGKCFWCGAAVVIARKVEQAQRRSLNHETLTLVNGSQVLVATLDHLDGVLCRPARRLVVACYPCNSARARTERLFARFLLERCQSFGGQIPKPVQKLVGGQSAPERSA